jgi:hypothetical protein
VVVGVKGGLVGGKEDLLLVGKKVLSVGKKVLLLVERDWKEGTPNDWQQEDTHTNLIGFVLFK